MRRMQDSDSLPASPGSTYSSQRKGLTRSAFKTKDSPLESPQTGSLTRPGEGGSWRGGWDWDRTHPDSPRVVDRLGRGSGRHREADREFASRDPLEQGFALARTLPLLGRDQPLHGRGLLVLESSLARESPALASSMTTVAFATKTSRRPKN